MRPTGTPPVPSSGPRASQLPSSGSLLLVLTALSLIILIPRSSAQRCDDVIRQWVASGTGPARGILTAADCLSGTLPPELGNLTKIATISFDGTGIGGQSPATTTQLSGTIPPEIARLEGFDSCEPCGKKPDGTDFLCCQAVPFTIFCATRTKLSGTIPSGFFSNRLAGGGTRTLQMRFRVGYTRISGTLPADMLKLPLANHMAQASCPINTVKAGRPCEYGDLRGLGLKLPTNFTGLQDKLTKIDLSFAGGGIAGTLPSEFGLLTKLKQLSFRYSELTGTIPKEIWSLIKLTDLSFAETRLNGTIPGHDLANLQKLTSLNLGSSLNVGSSGGLQGPLPDIELPALTSCTLLPEGGDPSGMGSISFNTSIIFPTPHYKDTDCGGNFPQQNCGPVDPQARRCVTNCYRCCSDGGPGAGFSNCPFGTDADYCGDRYFCPKGSEPFSAPKGSLGTCSGIDPNGPACMQCPRGKHKGKDSTQNEKAAPCTPCEKGRYADTMGSTSCTLCPVGTYNPAFQSTVADTCLKCGAGFYSNTSGEANPEGCTACDAGKSSALRGQSAETACKPCAAGQYSTSTGAGLCSTCPAGKYSDQIAQSAASSCIACQKGRFNAAAGSSQSAACAACTAGTYGDQTGAAVADDCVSCKSGKFGQASGQTSEQVACTACASGRFAAAERMTFCQSCSPGQYGTQPGQSLESSACAPCKTGKWSSVAAISSQLQCNDCPIGSFGAPAGSTLRTACLPCPAFSYGVRSGAALEAEACSSCPTGMYQDEPGKVSCEPANCPPGRYGTIRPQCTDCVAGKYNPSPGAGDETKCFACPKGRYGVQSASTSPEECLACGAGRFGARPGANSSSCSGACPPGQYSSAESLSCLACGPGKFQPNASSTSCASCPIRETTMSDAAVECQCDKGYFRDRDDTCAICPESFICERIGITLEDVGLVVGTWRPDNRSTAVVDCPVPEACDASSSSTDAVSAAAIRGVGSHDGLSSTSNGTTQKSLVDPYCADGHLGILCAVCDDGWYRLTAKSLCQRCPEDASASLGRTIALTSVIFIVVVALIILDVTRGWCSNKSGGIRLNGIMNAVQSLSVLMAFPIKWPPFVKELARLLQGFNVDISLIAPSCLGWIPMTYFDRLLFSGVLTGLGIIVPWVLLLLVCFCKVLAGRGFTPKGDDSEGNDSAGKPVDNSRKARFSRLLATHTTVASRYAVFIILLIHPAVSGQAFFFFSCRAVEQLQGDGTRQLTNYLVVDYSLECHTDKWFRMLPLALLLVVGFAFGTPLVLLFLLVRYREAILLQQQQQQPQQQAAAAVDQLSGNNRAADTSNSSSNSSRSNSSRSNSSRSNGSSSSSSSSSSARVASMLGTLWQVWKPKYYYFEIVNLFFKLALWGSLVFFGFGSQLQVGTALLICCVRLVLHAATNPHKSEIDNLIDLLYFSVTALLSLGGLLLQYLETSRQFATLRSDTAGVREAETAAAGVDAALNVLVVIVCIGFAASFAHLLYQNRRHFLACCSRIQRRCCCRVRAATGGIIQELQRLDTEEGKHDTIGEHGNPAAAGGTNDGRPRSTPKWQENPAFARAESSRVP